MTRCYTRCALLLIALAASAETSSAQHGKATPPRSLLTGSGEQTFTMTEIGGQPAIRHSPTKLTLHFNLASAGVDNGCRYWNARMELSRRDRSIRIGAPYSSREQGDPCPPALEAQGARLADALAKVETYEDAGNELRLIGAGQILARFALVRGLWPPSVLPGGATFWLSVEVGGDATAGDDRLTLNLVGRNVIGRAGSCQYSGHVRHGHGEITFWNLSTVSGSCRETRVHALLDALARATHYAMEWNALVLSAADGFVLARFQVNASDVMGTWRLVEVAGRSSFAAIDLSLPDGKMKGGKSCDAWFGRIRLGDGMVVFSPAPSEAQSECRLYRTPIAEPGLPRNLSRARRYEVSGDELTFFDDGKKIAVWRRVGSTKQ